MDVTVCTWNICFNIIINHHPTSPVIFELRVVGNVTLEPRSDPIPPSGAWRKQAKYCITVIYPFHSDKQNISIFDSDYYCVQIRCEKR
jgi:hypothetical protein